MQNIPDQDKDCHCLCQRLACTSVTLVSLPSTSFKCLYKSLVHVSLPSLLSSTAPFRKSGSLNVGTCNLQCLRPFSAWRWGWTLLKYQGVECSYNSCFWDEYIYDKLDIIFSEIWDRSVSSHRFLSFLFTISNCSLDFNHKYSKAS